MSVVFPSERIEKTILLLRGHKIILDRDLAAMYGVSTRDLNKAVSRNLDRFPDDFMLQLTRSEFNNLKFQFGTSSWGGTRKLQGPLLNKESPCSPVSSEVSGPSM